MKRLLPILVFVAVLTACQKEYEKTITESMSEQCEYYNKISISEPAQDCIDSTMWMPLHKIALGKSDYYGPVQVVEHTYTKDAIRKDTVRELWVFDENLERVIFISEK